jgi:hypothetical protein
MDRILHWSKGPSIRIRVCPPLLLPLIFKQELTSGQIHEYYSRRYFCTIMGVQRCCHRGHVRSSESVTNRRLGINGRELSIRNSLALSDIPHIKRHHQSHKRCSHRHNRSHYNSWRVHLLLLERWQWVCQKEGSQKEGDGNSRSTRPSPDLTRPECPSLDWE